MSERATPLTGEDLRDSLRRTWELELLISGAVVFALFQVPSALDGAFLRLDVHLSTAQGFLLFFAYAYLKMIVHVLTAAFFVHLLARAFWIGLLGLQAVYPEGVLWDELKEGPLMIEELRRLPTVPQLLERTDRLASSIFSFASLLVSFFLLSVFLAGGLAGAALLITALWPSGPEFKTVFWVLLVLWVVPSSLPSLIDKAYRRRGKRPPPRLERLLRPMIRGYLKSIAAGLYFTIFYTFITHLTRRRANLLLGAIMVVLFGGLFAQIIAMRSEQQLVHGYRYLPAKEGRLTLQDRYYENLREPHPRHARLPTLSSDVADEPFLTLFLPYRPSIDNESIETLCPDVEPWPWKLRPPKEPAEPKDEEKAVACLSRLYEIQLDGKPLEPEFVLYRHPQTQARGLLTYLRTAELEPGRHLLQIDEVRPESEDPPPVHYLPFWR